MTFDELGVNPQLCQALTNLGFQAPMPIQEAVIPHLLQQQNHDLIALAQTGTGKTAAFGVPLLQLLQPQVQAPQSLVMAPTRELCVQICRELDAYASLMPKIKTLAVYGGTPIEPQIRALKQGVHLIVATPGRLLDLHRRGAVDCTQLHTVVLDEADEMLNMGFSESINEILALLPAQRQLLLFSATMPAEIARLSKKYMQNPTEVTVGKRNEANANIRHRYYMVPAQAKYLALKRIIDYYPNIYGIIFCRTRRDTAEVAQKLIQDGYNAEALHGDLSQAQRDYVMQKFRLRNLQLLVATDVAARGLDVESLTHVIHYSLPEDNEAYTHRSGRTARAGKSGSSIAICHLREHRRLRQIEQSLSISFEEGKIPSGQEICHKKLYAFVDKLEHTIPNEQDLLPYLTATQERLAWLNKEELLKRLLYMELDRLISYYQQAEEIPQVEPPKKQKTTKKNEPKTSSKGFQLLRINIGKRDRVYPNTLIDILNHCLQDFVEIGKIDIYDSYTLFEVPQKEVPDIVDEVSQYELHGRQLHVTIANASARKGNKGEYRNGKRDGTRKANRKWADASRKKQKTKRSKA